MARSPQASSSATSAPVTALRSPPPPLALGQRVGDQTQLVRPREHVVGQLAGFAALARARPHLAGRELAHGLDDEPAARRWARSRSRRTPRCVARRRKRVEIIQEIEVLVNWTGRSPRRAARLRAGAGRALRGGALRALTRRGFRSIPPPVNGTGEGTRDRCRQSALTTERCPLHSRDGRRPGSTQSSA